MLCSAAGRSLWCVAESSMLDVSDAIGECGRYFIIQFLPRLVKCSSNCGAIIFYLLYAFFWVIPQRLKFICQRFGTLCLFHFHRQVGACRMN